MGATHCGKYSMWDLAEINRECLCKHIVFLVLSLPFCSCVNVWKAMIWKSKTKEKQTVGMRSRRKPVKPGDRGQLSQIHITKRSYKSSRGAVSVDPAKIKPSLTIQGHQHGTHGGPGWVTTSNKDKIYIHHSRADTVCLMQKNMIYPLHVHNDWHNMLHMNKWWWSFTTRYNSKNWSQQLEVNKCTAYLQSVGDWTLGCTAKPIQCKNHPHTHKQSTQAYPHKKAQGLPCAASINN